MIQAQGRCETKVPKACDCSRRLDTGDDKSATIIVAQVGDCQYSQAHVIWFKTLQPGFDGLPPGLVYLEIQVARVRYVTSAREMKRWSHNIIVLGMQVSRAHRSILVSVSWGQTKTLNIVHVFTHLRVRHIRFVSNGETNNWHRRATPFFPY